MRTTCWGHRGHRSTYSRLVDNNNIRSSVFDVNHLVKIALRIVCSPNKKSLVMMQKTLPKKFKPLA